MAPYVTEGYYFGNFVIYQRFETLLSTINL